MQILAQDLVALTLSDHAVNRQSTARTQPVHQQGCAARRASAHHVSQLVLAAIAFFFASIIEASASLAALCCALLLTYICLRQVPLDCLPAQVVHILQMPPLLFQVPLSAWTPQQTHSEEARQQFVR